MTFFHRTFERFKRFFESASSERKNETYFSMVSAINRRYDFFAEVMISNNNFTNWLKRYKYDSFIFYCDTNKLAKNANT